MKYLKTYEDIIPWLFASKNLKKITKGISKILEKKNYKWEYTNISTFLILIPENTLSINDITIDITEQKQWIEIMIQQNNKDEEILYIKSLLNTYGQLIPKNLKNRGFDQYFLAFSNIKKFIEKLTIQDFELYSNTNKYNI